MDLPALTAYLWLGAVACLAGLFGLGGGIVIVPALFFLYLRQGFTAELCMHLAVGSSLATVAFTSVTSASAASLPPLRSPPTGLTPFWVRRSAAPCIR